MQDTIMNTAHTAFHQDNYNLELEDSRTGRFRKTFTGNILAYYVALLSSTKHKKNNKGITDDDNGKNIVNGVGKFGKNIIIAS